MFDNLVNDLRIATRQLLKTKGFTITALLTLALGLGANTAIFTLVHAVLLQSLPVANPDQLLRLGNNNNCCNVGYQTRFSLFTYRLYQHVRDNTAEFEELAAFQADNPRVGVRRGGVDAPPDPAIDQFVSGNYFSMFGIKPFAGRLFTSADDTRGAEPVAVMSYKAWQRFGGDQNLLGSSFVIDAVNFKIVGITP